MKKISEIIVIRIQEYMETFASSVIYQYLYIEDSREYARRTFWVNICGGREEIRAFLVAFCYTLSRHFSWGLTDIHLKKKTFLHKYITYIHTYKHKRRYGFCSCCQSRK